MSHPEIRVLLADDHRVFRTAVRRILEEAPDIRVVAEADNGELAVAGLQRWRPDVAILDLDMPGKDGLEVALSVRDLGLPVKVVLLTVHKSEALVTRARDFGLSGYVLKDGVVLEIIDCVRAVYAGHLYFSPVFSSLLLTQSSKNR